MLQTKYKATVAQSSVGWSMCFTLRFLSMVTKFKLCKDTEIAIVPIRPDTLGGRVQIVKFLTIDFFEYSD